MTRPHFAKCAVTTLLILAFAAASCTAGSVDVTVDPGTSYQTMRGWEATAWAAHLSPAYPKFRDTLVDLAVNDVGINRLRLEVRSGSENSRDYFVAGADGRLLADELRCARYATQNDNDDPRVINEAGFSFAELDRTIESVVLPMQRALANRGQRLVLEVTYVSFMRVCTAGERYDHRSAEEYAEFVLATVLHMRKKHQLTPDLWEIILEPDNTDDWRGESIGRAMVVTDALLREHDLRVGFVAPSNTALAGALQYYDALRAVPGASALLSELAYHRYRGVTEELLRGVAERGRRDSVPTAMLEHIGSGIDDLLDDLTIGGVSAWSQYALAGKGDGTDKGGAYFLIDNQSPDRPVVREAAHTRFLRQLFSVAPLGSVRIGAGSSSNRVARAVAFRNPTGSVAAVVRTTRATSIVFRGLPQGRYRVSFATDSLARGTLEELRVDGTGAAPLRMPAAGVLTVQQLP